MLADGKLDFTRRLRVNVNAAVYYTFYDFGGLKTTCVGQNMLP